MAALAFFVVLLFGLVQLGVGWWGIEHLCGWGWALAVCLLAVATRFTLPLTIGVFFGARDVLGWHWLAALGLALPGILFMVPAAMVAISSLFLRKRVG